jgi:hypothetical protein
MAAISSLTTRRVRGLGRGRRDVRVAIRILNQFRETTRACSSSDEVFE